LNQKFAFDSIFPVTFNITKPSNNILSPKYASGKKLRPKTAKYRLAKYNPQNVHLLLVPAGLKNIGKTFTFVVDIRVVT
jgi:hypothetical protein